VEPRERGRGLHDRAEERSLVRLVEIRVKCGAAVSLEERASIRAVGEHHRLHPANRPHDALHHSAARLVAIPDDVGPPVAHDVLRPVVAPGAGAWEADHVDRLAIMVDRERVPDRECVAFAFRDYERPMFALIV
jgi:hypothetical protein